MKKYILLAFIFLSNYSFAQTNEVERIATFCKVWGFLKYYHPEVAKGKENWDSVFMSQIKILYELENKKAINEFYSDWIKSLGDVPACKKCNNKWDFTANYDNGWLGSAEVFSAEVTKQLQWIESNINNDTNFFL